MKKSILVISTVLLSISLMALGYIKWDHSVTNESHIGCAKAGPSAFIEIERPPVLNLPYLIGNRFATAVSKEDIYNAKSLIELLPAKATVHRKDFQNSSVSLLHGEDEITELGKSEVFNAAQTKLLRSMDYAADFRITANCRSIFEGKPWYVEDSLVYYLTVVPERVAEYIGPHDNWRDYLIENSRAETSGMVQEKLKSGRINFTVTKDGTIENVMLDSSSGYDSYDRKIVELVHSIPGEWIPARNEKAEKIDQLLVLSFGMVGC